MEVKSIAELESILAVEQDSRKRIVALLELNSALKRSDFQRSLQACSEAVKLADELKDQALLAKAHVDLGNALWKNGDNVKAQEHYAAGLAIHQERKDYAGMAHAYCGLGIVHGNLQDSANALEFFEKAVAAATRVGDDVTLAHNLGNIGHVYANIEDYITALKYFAKALAIDRELGDAGRQGVSNMLGAIAGVMVFQGEYDGAIAKLEESLIIDEEISNKRGIAVTQMNLGITYHKAGRYPEAISYLKRALSYAEKIHFVSLIPNIYQNLAETFEAIGDTDEAVRCMRRYNENQVAENRMHVQRRASQIIGST